MSLDLSKASHIAQILSLLPGGYCAYAAWLTLHPGHPAAVLGSQLPAVPASGEYMSLITSTGVLVAFGAFVALLAVGVILGIVSREPDPSKLVVHYARYGIGDRWWWQFKNVTAVVRGYIKDGSVDIVASNEYFGDPFMNKPKHFTIKYSYGGITRITVKPEGQRLKLPEISAAVAATKLKIHSAFYGVGNHNDIDLAETLQKMIPSDALAIMVDNNLIAGRPDPAPNQLKELKVIYSFGGPATIPLSVPEHKMLILPRDSAYGRELGLQYERQRIREVEALEKKLGNEIARLEMQFSDEVDRHNATKQQLTALQKQGADSGNMYALREGASEADRVRRHRAVMSFKALSVPQKFTLRLISKYQRIHNTQLVELAQQANFGEDPASYVEELGTKCDLVKRDSGGDYLIDAALIEDVDAILSAWFTKIASSSEAL